MRKRPGSDVIKRIGCLFALMLAPSAVPAQSGPCAGQVEHTPVDGVGLSDVVAVDNHRMVTSDGPTFTSWRLGDPTSPELLGRWTEWDEASLSLHRMEVDDRGFAYAGFGAVPWVSRVFSIRIWDLRAAITPAPVAVFPGGWVDFFVDGDLLMGVGTRNDDDIIAHDIGDPTRPRLVCEQCGNIALGNGPPNWGAEYLRIAGADGLAVVLDFDELLVLDTSDPAAPVVLSTVALGKLYGLDCRLWANERVAVLATNMDHGLEVVDFSNPHQPTVVEVDADASGSAWGDFHGDVLVFQDEYMPAARRLDLTDPALPVFLPPIPFDSWPRAGAVWDGRLYVGTGSDIRVVDLAGTPTEVGAGPPATYADRIAVSGSEGLATGGQVLIVFDLGEPAGPVETARIELDWWPRLPATDRSFGAVLKAGPGGVAVLDLRNLASPVFLDTVPTEGFSVSGIEVGNGLLAVASRDDFVTGWLELWEVAFGASPVFLSRIDLGEPVWQIERVGDRVFLGLVGEIVEVDIADPTAPVVGAPLDLQYLDSSVSGLAVVEEELFAIDGFNVAVVDISVPGTPVERPVVNRTLEGPTWLVAGGDSVVAGSNSGRLTVMQSPPASGLVPMIDLRPPAGSSREGGIFSDTLILAGRHELTTMDLSCAPLQADFTWYSMGTQVRFIDRTTFDDQGDDRGWQWSIDGGPPEYQSRSPLVEFDDYGSYEITVEVTTEAGTVATTKTVEVAPHPGTFLIFTDGFEFRNTAAWSRSIP